MTDVLKFGKKFFTVGVVVTTILWSVGVAALVGPLVAGAAVCPTLAAGDMIKVTGKPAIYSVNKDLKVLYFPSGDEFKSWNVNESYGGYVSVTQECFDSLPVPSAYPGAVNYRAGSYVVKRPSSDQLYAVLPGNSLAKVSVADAKVLYGATYKVMTVADAFWPHYVNRGADVAGLAHEGMLVKKDGVTYYVAAGNVLREVTATGMTANGLKSAFVRTVAASALAGLTVGTQLTAKDATLANRTQDGAIVVVVTPTGGNLTVTLAADNPAAKNLADGSAYNDLLKLNLTAGSSATNVTGITLTKTGLIANSKITGVSVWDSAGNRHGDVMTSLTSDNKVSVSFSSNPIKVAAGSTDTLLVKLNLDSTANSGLVGLRLAAAADLSTNGTVGGSFPLEGNQMSIIDGNASLASTTIAYQSVGGIANGNEGTAANANLEIGDLQKEIAKFKFTEQSGNEDVVISKLVFYFEGTVQDKDVKNFKVYGPDGSLLGTAEAIVDRYVTVNFTSPYTLPKSTNRTLSLKADIADGSSRYFRVHIQNDYDVLMKGVTTGFYTVPANFSDQKDPDGWFRMKAGSVTLNKNTASPAGNISAGASGIVLAKFDVKAVGEDLEFRKMGLGVSKNLNGGADKNLSGNVIVRDAADGTVYLTVAASGAAVYLSATQYNLSSYFTLKSGVTKSLEVVGSVDSTATATKYQVGIGNFYAKRLSTLDYADNLPASTNTSTEANQLSVNSTALSCYKDTAMGDANRSTGATVVLGQYICTAGTAEAVRLTNVTMGFEDAGTLRAADSVQNLSLWDGTTQLGSTLSTAASTSNAFNFDLTLAANQTKTLQFKGFIVSGATGSASSSLDSTNYTGVNSGSSNTGSKVIGQKVTVQAGNLTVTAVSDGTTLSKVYGPGQTGVQVGKWKLAAANDSVTLNKITLTARYAYAYNTSTATEAQLTASTLGTYGGLSLYDGSTLLGTASFVNGDAVFTGLSLSVPMDGTKYLTLKGNTNGSGVISNNTSTLWAVKSDSNTDMEARSGAGALLSTADILGTSGANTYLASSSVYMFHDAYPTMAAQSLGTALTLGSQAQIFKYTITNNGSRDLRLGTTTVNINATGLASTSVAGIIGNWKLWEDNGAGGLGSQLSATGTKGIAGGAYAASSTLTDVAAWSTDGTLTVVFGEALDVNNLLANFTVSPGASRTFIVTADTQGVLGGKSTGVVTVSGKITGSTGWSATNNIWNTGNLQYLYTPVGGAENTAPYSHSDSFDVTGGSLSYAL